MTRNTKNPLRPRRWWLEWPIIALTFLTMVTAATAAAQLWLPITPSVSEAPRLIVQIETVELAETELLFSQSIVADEDGGLHESFSLHLDSGDQPATISSLTIGWSGGREEWSCFIFNTSNPDATTSADADLEASFTWERGTQKHIGQLEQAVEGWNPTMEQAELQTVLREEFPTGAPQRASGIDCSRDGRTEDQANARVRVNPTFLLADLPHLDREPVSVRYPHASVRIPSEWRSVSGSVESVDVGEPSDGYITYLGGTAINGPLTLSQTYAVPAREQWMAISAATLTVLVGAWLGVILQGLTARSRQEAPATAQQEDASVPRAASAGVGVPSRVLRFGLATAILATLWALFRRASSRGRRG